MRKRISALLLTLAMLLTLLPTAAFARPAPTDEKAAIIVETNEKYDSVQDAFDYALPGQTVRLLKDCDCEEAVTLMHIDEWYQGVEGRAKLTLDLDGYVLNGCESDSVLDIDNRTDLTLTDSNTGNKTHNFKVGSNGLWTLTEETEGAVALEDLTKMPKENAVITVTGGCITGGKVSSVGGGGVTSGGSFTMKKGNIVGNTAANGSGGGGVMCSDLNTDDDFPAVFNMEGGSIIGNICVRPIFGIPMCYGAGVYLSKNVSFNMSGGTIAYNSTPGFGGGVSLISYVSSPEDSEQYEHLASMTMTGGTISCNKANSGAGIYISRYSDFTMSDGEISNNTSNNDGGGVYNSGSFCMNGGSITGNDANGSGGGVFIHQDGTAKITGGSITGNTANVSGGGVFGSDYLNPLYNKYDYSKITVGGSAQIIDNTLSSGKDSNCCFPSGSPLTIGTDIDAPNDKMAVGVTLFADADSTSSISGRFTGNGAKADEEFFFSDNTAYADKYNDEGYLELVTGYTVTKDNCENGSVSVGNLKSAYEGETVTVTATPDSGYVVSEVFYQPVGDENPTEITAMDGVYSFTMPDEEVTVSASFEAEEPDTPDDPTGTLMAFLAKILAILPALIVFLRYIDRII